MEEKIPTKTRIKEWAFVIGVIVVVTVASIIAYNYGLKQGKDTKEETPTTQTGDSEPTQNDIVSQEIIDELINIVGAKDTDCYNTELNYYVNELKDKDILKLTGVEIYELFDKYVIFNNLTHQDVEHKYCSDEEYGGYCIRYTLEDYNEFTKNYSINLEASKLANDLGTKYKAIIDNGNIYVATGGDACASSSSYSVTAVYNGNDEIILSAEIIISNTTGDMGVVIENYEYTFQKSIDGTKNEYYLTKVEKLEN